MTVVRSLFIKLAWHFHLAMSKQLFKKENLFTCFCSAAIHRFAEVFSPYKLNKLNVNKGWSLLCMFTPVEFLFQMSKKLLLDSMNLRKAAIRQYEPKESCRFCLSNVSRSNLVIAISLSVSPVWLPSSLSRSRAHSDFRPGTGGPVSGGRIDKGQSGHSGLHG